MLLIPESMSGETTAGTPGVALTCDGPNGSGLGDVTAGEPILPWDCRIGSMPGAEPVLFCGELPKTFPVPLKLLPGGAEEELASFEGKQPILASCPVALQMHS